MKKNVLVMVFVGLLGISFAACGKGEGPTTPTLPNKFEITGIENYGYSWGTYGVVISYANNTDSDALMSGKVYFGDGVDMDVSAITNNPAGYLLQAKISWSGEVGRFNHDYAASGTYRVKAEFTANFKNGAISKTFEKDFTITVR